MFEDDWFCWREFATTMLSPRVRISFPSAKGYAVVREEGGKEVTTRRAHKGFDAALAAYCAEIDALLRGGYFEHPRPRVMERVRDGVRIAMLLRLPTTTNVEWTMVRWENNAPIEWTTEFYDTLGAALHDFSDRCIAARNQGFRDWVPSWPEGIRAVSEDKGLFTEHTTWSDAEPSVAMHRWYSAPGHAEVGPEMHCLSDGSVTLLCQIDGRSVGPTIYFKADALTAVITRTAGQNDGVQLFHEADGSLTSLAVYRAGVFLFSMQPKDDGWTAASRIDWSRKDRIELGLEEGDFGPFDLAYCGARGYGSNGRVIAAVEGSTIRRRRCMTDRGKITLDEFLDAAGTLERSDTYEPAGTLLSRVFYTAGAPERGERYHPNGVVSERQGFDPDGKFHGVVKIYDRAGMLTETVEFEHGERGASVDVWHDLSAAVDCKPDAAAFQRACHLFAQAHRKDPKRALAESLPAWVEGTRAWPIETRIAPPYWINDLVEGRLPNEALRPIAALRVLDLAVDARDGFLCARGEFEARLARFGAWLAALPNDPSLAVDVLDLSLSAWSSHSGSLPTSDRSDAFDLRAEDFDASYVDRVLASPLASRLRALVVSRSEWSDMSPGNHDSYLNAESHQRGPSVEWPDDRPRFLERLAKSPCAATLETLIARNADLREPKAGTVFPALKTLDVGYGPRQPNELLASLSKGWAPSLQTLLIETAYVLRWALEMQDPKELARFRANEENFFGHDYCCEPHELLLDLAVVKTLRARKGVPTLATIVVGEEKRRFKASRAKPTLAREAPWDRTFLDRGVVHWT